MAMKLATLVILLMFCYSSLSTHFNVKKVPIPSGCCNACPPQSDPSRFVCARHSVTGELGMFDSECFFGRYNHCSYVKQREWFIFNNILKLIKSLFPAYTFIRKGHCQTDDF